MIPPNDKCSKCREYLYGYCTKVRALYDAVSPEQIGKATQEIRDCTWQSDGHDSSTHQENGK